MRNMRRCVRWAWVAVLAFVLSLATAGGELRVRKELRSLSPTEYRLFVTGWSTMLTVGTREGQALFGPRYREYNYFLVKHAVSTRIPALVPGGNGTQAAIFDLAHFGPWFVTFHAALLLEMENALLSVVPDLKAMPYWAMYEDLKGTPKSPGRYYNTSENMFTDKYAGPLTGDPANHYQVMGGVFGGRPVPFFDYEKYANVSHIFNGSSTGQLRSSDEPYPFLIRYPAEGLAQVPFFAYYAPGLDMNFTKADLMRCADPGHVKSMWEFILCIDFTAVAASGVQDAFPEMAAKWTTGPLSISQYNHNLMHATVGGALPGSFNATTGDAAFGDTEDLSCSPIDTMTFAPFHSNLVRAFMVWQRASAARMPLLASDQFMWFYPKTAQVADPPLVWPGAELDAQIAPLMPFVDVFDYPTPNGITNRDVLRYLMRDDTITYDDMSLA